MATSIQSAGPVEPVDVDTKWRHRVSNEVWTVLEVSKSGQTAMISTVKPTQLGNFPHRTIRAHRLRNDFEQVK